MTKLIIRDLKDIEVRYLLVLNRSNKDIEQVLMLEKDDEVQQCQSKDLEILVTKLKEFVGDKPFKSKIVLINLLEQYCSNKEESNNSEASYML